MKKHNIVKVVLITFLVIVLLSWILPAAYYSGEYAEQGRLQMGLSEFFNYSQNITFPYFGHIILFIILIGCFYGVLYKIPAYRTYLDWVVAKFKGKEIIFISLVVILLACGVSIAGLNLPFLLFVPLFASIILLMGYDKIVAALTIVGGIGAGLIGSTYAYNNLSLLCQILSIDSDYQIAVRFIILAASIILVLFNILMYIKRGNGAKVAMEVSDMKIEAIEEDVVEPKEEKVEEASEKDDKSNNKSNEKKNAAKSETSKKTGGSKKSSSKAKGSKSGTKKSTRGGKNPNKAALKQEDVIVVKDSVNGSNDSYLVPTNDEEKHTVWPFVVGFFLLFVLVVMAFITWGENGFGITLFDEITEKVTGFELYGFPIFAKIYGTVNSFGNWTVLDLFLPVLLLTVILAIIYRVKFDDILDGIAMGVKKSLTPALIVLLLYTILVVATFHPFQLVIYKVILGLSDGFNIFTTTAVAFLSSLFNVDPSYIFQSVVPYYTSVVTSAKNYTSAAIIFQTVYGFSSLVAPTSVILMTVLSYLNVGYKEWLKSSWKLILEVLAILLIIFMILII